jgi:Na+/phosphate symporter
LFTIGSGLLSTLGVETSLGAQIGYQILAGAGLGACMQIPFIAVQVVLSANDMALGNAVMFFFTTLGGALAVPIAQSVFINTLYMNLPPGSGTVFASPHLSGAGQVSQITIYRLEDIADFGSFYPDFVTERDRSDSFSL